MRRARRNAEHRDAGDTTSTMALHDDTTSTTTKTPGRRCTGKNGWTVAPLRSITLFQVLLRLVCIVRATAQRDIASRRFSAFSERQDVVVFEKGPSLCSAR